MYPSDDNTLFLHSRLTSSVHNYIFIPKDTYEGECSEDVRRTVNISPMRE